MNLASRFNGWSEMANKVRRVATPERLCISQTRFKRRYATEIFMQQSSHSNGWLKFNYRYAMNASVT